MLYTIDSVRSRVFSRESAFPIHLSSRMKIISFENGCCERERANDRMSRAISHITGQALCNGEFEREPAYIFQADERSAAFSDYIAPSRCNMQCVLWLVRLRALPGLEGEGVDYLFPRFRASRAIRPGIRRVSPRVIPSWRLRHVKLHRERSHRATRADRGESSQFPGKRRSAHLVSSRAREIHSLGPSFLP